MITEVLLTTNLRLFISLFIGMMILGLMLTNHLTWRRYISHCVMSLIRTVASVIAIILVQHSNIISISTTYYLIALMVVIGASVIIAYTLAKIGLVLSDKRDTTLATLHYYYCRVLAKLAHTSRAKVYTVKFENMAHDANLQRVPVLIRRAAEIRQNSRNGV